MSSLLREPAGSGTDERGEPTMQSGQVPRRDGRECAAGDVAASPRRKRQIMLLANAQRLLRDPRQNADRVVAQLVVELTAEHDRLDRPKRRLGWPKRSAS